MKTDVRKFGEILISRPAGREAALAMRAYLEVKPNEKIELDFEGVLSVGPSWLDEVMEYLKSEYGKERIVCLPASNPSVNESLKVIETN